MAYEKTGRPPGRPKADAPRDADGKLIIDGKICPECFPLGWPADSVSAGCRHGEWTR